MYIMYIVETIKETREKYKKEKKSATKCVLTANTSEHRLERTLFNIMYSWGYLQCESEHIGGEELMR